MNLKELGWTDEFEKSFQAYGYENYLPGRIINQAKGQYKIATDNAIFTGKLSGKYMHRAYLKKDYPVVGDWVIFKEVDQNEGVIEYLLPRRNYFARKLAISGGRKMKNGVLVGGYIEEQLIGANIDTAFIVSGLDENFNIRRIERYITLAHSSGVAAVILLNKSDLCKDLKPYLDEIDTVSKNIPVHALSALERKGLKIFENYLQPGKTVVFLGSSGVGKSSIINALFKKDIQVTKTVSQSNGKGRHTTTGSQILVHENGGILIDTPGMRELQLWADESVLDETFEDVKTIISKCKFSNCSHNSEVGCAVRLAINEGSLTDERYGAYLAQLRELKTLKQKRKAYDNSLKNTYKRSSTKC